MSRTRGTLRDPANTGARVPLRVLGAGWTARTQSNGRAPCFRQDLTGELPATYNVCMHPTTASYLARKLMNEHGLGHWSFRFDARAVKRLGACRHGERTISLSEKLVRLADEATVRNTILHEIAHALVGPGHGHNAVWRRKATAIGCDGERYHKLDTNQLAPWRAVCPSCAKPFHRHRLAANVRDNSACPHCRHLPTEARRLVWQRVA